MACDLCLLRFHAACTYSLIRPLRTGFRRIWRVRKSPAVMQGGWRSPSGDALVDALVRSGRVVVLLIFSQDGAQVPLAENQAAVEEFAARVPMRRSQIAFIRGACTAVHKTVALVAWKTASKERVKFDPRSRIRNRKSPNRSPTSRARLRACCTVQSPVGWAVTPPKCIRRVPCSMNTRTYSLATKTSDAL